jgi:hypothetical protein
LNYNKKLLEFKSLLNFNDNLNGKELKNNYKFIEAYIRKIEKINIKSQATDWTKILYYFIQDAIDVHTRIYNM